MKETEERSPLTGLDDDAAVGRSRRSSVPPFRRHEFKAGAIVGAIAGAAIGIFAGPIGLLVGVVIGALLGGLAGYGLDRSDAERDRRDRELDEDIGVVGGDLGAPSLQHPPPTRGAYSAASAGAHVPGGQPSGGPISR